jgi:hypothetical protein
LLKTKIVLSYKQNNDLFLNQFNHKNWLNIVYFILNCSKQDCQKLVLYDKNLEVILIHVDLFIYKLSLLIKNRKEKENFLNKIYKNKITGFIENGFLSKIIEKINKATIKDIATKILYQEEKENLTVNFKSVKIVDKEKNKLYQGSFLHVHTRNKEFKEILKKDKNDIFKKICKHSRYEIAYTDEKGIKIRVDEIFDI